MEWGSLPALTGMCRRGRCRQGTTLGAALLLCLVGAVGMLQAGHGVLIGLPPLPTARSLKAAHLREPPRPMDNEACLALLKHLATATTLVALRQDSLAWLASNETSFPPLLSLAVVEEDRDKLLDAIPDNVQLIRESVESDPRYLHPDPLVHRNGVRLRDAHLILLPRQGSCAFHIATLFPRGADASGAPTFNWMAPIDLSESLSGLVIQDKARAFAMQKLVPARLASAKFGEEASSAYNIAGVEDAGKLEWELRWAYRECPLPHAHHFRRGHFNESNERLTREMKTRLRDGLLLQMDRFNRLRIAAFAVAGTLLGWARECDVLSYADIPGNTDVDFGVFARDTPGQAALVRAFSPERQQQPELRRALGNFKVQTYEIRWSYVFKPPLNGPAPGKAPLYRAIAMDLFVLFPNPDPPNTAHYSIIYTGEKRFWNNINVPILDLKEICSSELNGVLIRVPCDPLGFLEAAYGTRWSEPHQRWSYGGGRDNFKRGGNWSKAQDDLIIQKAFDEKTNDERRKKLGPLFA